VEETTNVGDYVNLALVAIAEGGGIARDSNYPFTGVHGECYFNLSMRAVQIYGFAQNVIDSEATLA
jgi:hypothetical protein